MFYKLRFFALFAVLAFFNTQCENSTSSPEKSKITFTNVYFSGEVDTDDDDYASYAKLHYETEGNKDDLEVFVIIGVRYATESDTASYFLYMESVDYTTGKSDSRNVEIGSPNMELPHGCYDFLIQLFFQDKPEEVHAQASLQSFSDLKNVCFETQNEENPFTLTFNNPLFTDITIEVDGHSTKTAPVGGSATFEYEGNPGSISYYAYTNGQTSQGGQIGLKIIWDYTHDVSGLSSKTYNLNVGSAFFFIYLTNSGGANLNPFYVNYGRSEQTMDDIIIYNNSIKYRIGYYEAFSNTKVVALFQGRTDGVQWVQGTHFTLPWTDNQYVELLNTLSPGDALTKSFPKAFSERAESSPKYPQAENQIPHVYSSDGIDIDYGIGE
jgi:hypothetical protein